MDTPEPRYYADLRVRDLWLTEREDRAQKAADDGAQAACDLTGARHPAEFDAWQMLGLREW